VKPVFRVLLLSAVVFALTSCLSTEVELDLRNGNALILDLTYRMPIGLWEFGVFDDETPERAIPVSRRDAEETAVLYEDVTLVSYTLREEADRAVVHVVYRVESVSGLQGLWGRVAGSPLDLSFESGRLRLPLSSGGPDDGIDPQQRDLIEEVFDGEVFSVAIRTPEPITAMELPRIDGAEDTRGDDDRRIVWQAPMGALLSTETPAQIRIEWETTDQ
jgi:hypothetical protein